ncbi:MAG: hypothetical protein AAF196_09710 [Planctomycetota bacterium]
MRFAVVTSLLLLLTGCAWSDHFIGIRVNLKKGRTEWPLEGPETLSDTNPGTLAIEVDVDVSYGEVTVLVFKDERSTEPDALFHTSSDHHSGQLELHDVRTRRGRLVIEPNEDAVGYVTVNIDYR